MLPGLFEASLQRAEEHIAKGNFHDAGIYLDSSANLLQDRFNRLAEVSSQSVRMFIRCSLQDDIDRWEKIAGPIINELREDGFDM